MWARRTSCASGCSITFAAARSDAKATKLAAAGAARGVDRNRGRTRRAAARGARSSRAPAGCTTASCAAAASGSRGCSTTARPRRSSWNWMPTCCATGNAFGAYRAARDARRALEGLAREHQLVLQVVRPGDRAGFVFRIARWAAARARVSARSPRHCTWRGSRLGLLPLRLKAWPHEGPDAAARRGR